LVKAIIEQLESSLKETKGEGQEYIARALFEIGQANPEDLAEVSAIWAQNVQLKLAELAVKAGQDADRLLMLLVQIALAAAAEQITEI
jgi:hypothetical protein